MTSQSPANHGHPITAAAVVGSFSFALVLVMKEAGLLVLAEGALAGGYLARGFGLDGGAVQPWWDLFLAAVVVYAVVWLLFETPGTGRRVMVLLTALVLILALSPVLALWEVFWSPIGAGMGVAWGGFCALLWARQHRMPCELPVAQDVRGGKIIPIKKSEEMTDAVEEEVAKRPPGAKGGKKRRQRRK